MEKTALVCISLMMVLSCASASAEEGADPGKAAPSGKQEEVRKLPAQATPAGAAQARPAPGVTVPPAGGVMVIEQDLFDAGDVERGQPIEHTFIVKNTGKGPLTIKAKPG